MHYSLLADIVVIIHLAYACFVLFGFLAIVIGVYCNWVWIRNYPFRILHFACTAFVFLETVLSITCPLTLLENFFLRVSRVEGYNRSFIGNLVSKILFYDAPEWIFATIYVLLAIAVVIYYILFPPLRSANKLQHYKQIRSGVQ